MSGLCLVVLGAQGFLGSSVVAAARAHQRVREVRAVVRPRAGNPDLAADVRDGVALGRVIDEAHVVVNAAHVIGSGPHLAVNETGPPAVARAAARAGACCLELGTAAVYGRGPLRGGAEGHLDPAPSSTLSASRAIGEAAALGEGATVLRPMLVVGPGDRWVIPSAATAARADDRAPTARVSVIDVVDLARLVIDLGILAALDQAPLPPVLHVARRDPVALGDMIEAARFRPPPAARTSEGVPGMLHVDRWITSDRVWDLVGWEPTSPVITHAARRWYEAVGTPRSTVTR